MSSFDSTWKRVSSFEKGKGKCLTWSYWNFIDEWAGNQIFIVKIFSSFPIAFHHDRERQWEEKWDRQAKIFVHDKKSTQKKISIKYFHPFSLGIGQLTQQKAKVKSKKTHFSFFLQICKKKVWEREKFAKKKENLFWGYLITANLLPKKIHYLHTEKKE